MKNLLLVTALTVLPLSHGHAQLNSKADTLVSAKAGSVNSIATADIIIASSAGAGSTGGTGSAGATGSTGGTGSTGTNGSTGTMGSTGAQSDLGTDTTIGGTTTGDRSARTGADIDLDADTGFTDTELGLDTETQTDTGTRLGSDTTTLGTDTMDTDTMDQDFGTSQELGADTQTFGATTTTQGGGSFTVSEIEGRSIISENGDRLATIDSVVADRATGDMFAVVRSGGFFGMGGDRRVVPIDDLAMNEEAEVILRGNTELTTYNRMNEQEYNPIDENIQVNIDQGMGAAQDTGATTGTTTGTDTTTP